MEKDITLTLTAKQANFVLTCLSKAPYELSAALIQKIALQLNSQIDPKAQSDTQVEDVKVKGNSQETQVLQ